MGHLNAGACATKIPTIDSRIGILIALTCFSIVFRIWVSSPTWMHYDENYYINIAQNYQDRGELTPYMWRLGDINIISGGGSGYGIILLTEWLSLTGHSLFWGRMMMVAFGIAASFVMYKTSTLWWESKVAGSGALMYGLVSTSAFYTLILKMDSIAIFVYSILLFTYVSAIKTDRKFLYLLSGVISIISLEFHLIGMVYASAFSILCLHQIMQRIVTNKSSALKAGPVFFLIGALVTGIFYLLIHVIPDPKAFFLISKECFECNESIITTEWKRLIRMLVFRTPEVVVFTIIAVAAIKRQRSQDIKYLLLIVASLLTQAIIGIPPYSHYTNHLWPLAALGVGGFLAYGISGTHSRTRYNISLLIAIILLLSNVTSHLQGKHPYMLSYSLNRSEQVAFITKYIDVDTVVMGSVSSFYPLKQFRNYLSYRDGTLYGTNYRNESLSAFWHRISPEIIYLSDDEIDKDILLQTYISEKQMVKIMANLWISPSTLPKPFYE